MAGPLSKRTFPLCTHCYTSKYTFIFVTLHQQQRRNHPVANLPQDERQKTVRIRSITIFAIVIPTGIDCADLQPISFRQYLLK